MIRSLAPMAALLCSILLPWPAAATPDAADLMRRVNRQAAQINESVQMDMHLIDANGQSRERRAHYYQRLVAPNSEQSAKLIRFSAPPEMDGSGVLTVEQAGRPDDQWLYMPAYHTSRKIPSSNRSDRYMGTDFAYEDVSADKTEDYRYQATGQVVVGGRSYVQVEQLPLMPGDSAYRRKVQLVDPERLLVLRIDYYDPNNTLIKRFEGSNAHEIQGIWRWEQSMMTDFRINHRTVIDYSDRRIGQGVDAAVLTLRSLERGG